MSGPVDPVGDHQRHKNPGKPKQARGVVIQAPVGAHDSLVVQVLGFDSYEVPAGNWQPRPNPSLDDAGGAGAPLIPTRGTQCLVVTDHMNDVWIPIWSHV